jgi:hypothetical protein
MWKATFADVRLCAEALATPAQREKLLGMLRVWTARMNALLRRLRPDGGEKQLGSEWDIDWRPEDDANDPR